MKTNKEVFLTKFKDLEKYLRMDNNTYDEQTFSKYLDNSNNKFIKSNKNKDFLKTAGKLRNILAHNNDVAFPTEGFLKQFVDLTDKIISPKRANKLMITMDKCLVAKKEDKIFSVLNEMKEKRISTVPILDDKRVVGVFNETTLFQTLIDENGELIVDLKGAAFNDKLSDFSINKNRYYDYKFIRKDIDINDCSDLFEKGYKNDKRLELLFVTENGKEDEALLGIISIFDIVSEL